VVDKLKQLRELAAWVMLAAVAVHALWMLVTFLWYAKDGRFALGNAGWLVLTTQQSGVVVLATAIAVGACALWQPPSRNARLLALLASIGFAVVIAFTMIFAVIGMIGGATRLVMFRAGLLEAVVPALAGLITFRIYRSLPAPAPTRPQSSSRPGSHPAGPSQWGPPPQQPGGQPYSQGPSQLPYGGPPQRPPYASQQPPPQAQQPPAGQSWGPPAENRSGGWQNQTPDVRSQFDQFGNQERNSTNDFPGYSQPQVPGEWQPAAQPPPQRFEPSPDQPPIGPHTNPHPNPNTNPAFNQYEDQVGGRGGTQPAEDDHGRPGPQTPSR
jgi:hypothetical protein